MFPFVEHKHVGRHLFSLKGEVRKCFLQILYPLFFTTLMHSCPTWALEPADLCVLYPFNKLWSHSSLKLKKMGRKKREQQISRCSVAVNRESFLFLYMYSADQRMTEAQFLPGGAAVTPVTGYRPGCRTCPTRCFVFPGSCAQLSTCQNQKWGGEHEAADGTTWPIGALAWVRQGPLLSKAEAFQ